MIRQWHWILILSFSSTTKWEDYFPVKCILKNRILYESSKVTFATVAMVSHHSKLLVNSQNPAVAMNDIAFPGACLEDSPGSTIFSLPFNRRSFQMHVFLCAPAVLSQQKLPTQGDKLRINN